jgi:hypothetical protein
MSLLRYFAVIFVLALGCGPECIGTVPTPGEPARCDRTIEAMLVVDAVFDDQDFEPVAVFSTVTWVDGLTFTTHRDQMDGRPLWGHSEPSVTSSGLRCAITVATRMEPGPYQTAIAGTSLAHEMFHCSLAVTSLLAGDGEIDGDPEHIRPEWHTVVPRANQELAEKQL